jgi:Tfp pilus assembly protein PilO
VSEPVRLGQILPEVMRKIEKRVEAWAKMSDTKNQNQRSWQFNRRINLSVLIQLVFLASLIVGSWLNLQRQLDLLQHDVTTLLQSQKNFEQKLESLQAKSISYEYRLRVIEKRLPEANIGDESF